MNNGSKMESSIKVILYLIFAVSLITGINVLIGGALSLPEISNVEATVDNELRFFSIFWMAYGSFCFWVARNLSKEHHFVPFIAIVFFLGGTARLISLIFVGMPTPLFIPAMALEIVLPPIIYLLYVKQRDLYSQKK
mgnify:CR=1 FL=1